MVSFIREAHVDYADYADYQTNCLFAISNDLTSDTENLAWLEADNLPGQTWNMEK